MTLVVIMAASMGRFGLMAQNTPDTFVQKRAKQRPTPEQMMDRHVKMMEKKLAMEEAIAAKFIPLYKEYLQAMMACRLSMNKDSKKTGMTDAEIEKAIQDRFDAKKKELDVQQTYFKKFKEILNARQLEKVFQQPYMQAEMKHGRQHQRMMNSGDRPRVPGSEEWDFQ